MVIDLSEAHRQGVWLCWPRARIVVDRFQAVRRVGRALDRVRLRVQRRRGEERKGKLYRLRSARLRDPSNWTDAEAHNRADLFAALPKLHHAWHHKELFRAW